ncbi:MAG: lipid A biosynthesis acyltransferase, partial [Muribaculaceae bacterium]|nr:lipid A biosynthesis acyltransferase [Muribaculaceae bacterium]
MSELKHDNWAGTTYGNGWMHKWLIRFLKVINVRLLYLFAFVFIVPPTMFVNSKARKVIYRFYRKRFGYGLFKSCLMTYVNHCAFSQVVIDKFAMFAGKKFDITIDGYDHFLFLSEQVQGFVQLSSHIGNYEIAGYSLSSRSKRVNALVFGGEKESVMANRSRIFKENNIRMIPMMADMSHLFIIDQALSEG